MISRPMRNNSRFGCMSAVARRAEAGSHRRKTHCYAFGETARPRREGWRALRAEPTTEDSPEHARRPHTPGDLLSGPAHLPAPSRRHPCLVLDLLHEPAPAELGI